ncbi:MAG: hypothetical protein AAF597_17215, partial [Bacteroidota bacterium]
MLRALIFLYFLLLIGTLLTGQGLQIPKPEKPVQLSGSLSLGGFFYNTTREFTPISPYGYSFNANLNLRIKSLDIPLSVSVNEQGSTFRQPFNRFGISPKFKSLTVHLGHRNLFWSPFVLGG